MNRQLVSVLLVVAWLGFAAGAACGLAGEPSSPRVESLLQQMTLEEKIGQMTLYTSTWASTGPTMDQNYLSYITSGACGNIFNAFSASYTRYLQTLAVEKTRLGIPLLFGYDVIHGHRTIFPIPLGESCSWDLDLMERTARQAAIEAAAEGIHWTFAPMVDIARDPRWGRVSEGAGEDTWLGAQIAAARVRGFQGHDLAGTDTVAACAKHFAAYGAAQAGRDYHTVDLSERTLREVYLPPFQACVRAGVRTFMTAFNELAGTPCTANPWLLQGILRGEWGFSGVVVTDYTGINEMVPHGFAEDDAAAGRKAAQAGVDMDMQGGVFLRFLADQVKRGEVPMARIDEAVRRVLRLKEELGLFADPYRYCDEVREKTLVMTPEALHLSRVAAIRSMVLLKNDRRTLPLSPALKTLAVIGPLATATVDLLGNWHGAGDGARVTSVLDAVRQRLGSRSRVLFTPGCGVSGADRSGFKKALEIARKASAVVMVLGEHETMSGEAASRSEIGLPGVQIELVEHIARLKKPLAVVLLNGRPLVLERLHQHAPAILEAWFPGTMGGHAIADTLFGAAAPTGRLTMTFPRREGQIPLYYGMKNTGRPMDPNNKYTSKYLDVPNTPLYPFGHGLTYTTFRYGPPVLSTKTLAPSGAVIAGVNLTNTGARAGEELVQCYVRDLTGSVTRPVRELKGFQRVLLQPGETRAVNFRLQPQDLAFLRPDGRLAPEPGMFEVFVGANAQDAVSAGQFELLGTRGE